MGKMKMKKSAGADEISQEYLLIGKNVLAEPLTANFNQRLGCAAPNAGQNIQQWCSVSLFGNKYSICICMSMHNCM